MKADNVRTLEDIKELDGEIVNEKDLEILWELDLVEQCEGCGESGRYPGHNWYVFRLIDGTEVNVYTEFKYGL